MRALVFLWLFPLLLWGAHTARADLDLTSEIAARVALETPGDGGRSDWVDFHVDGGGVPSMERCERLVETELRHVYPEGSKIKAKVTRPCLARPLPASGPPMLEAQILRVEEPLPSLKLMTLSTTPTTGRIIRYTRMLSAIECERKREKLVASARAEPKHFLEEQAKLDNEAINKMCDPGVPKPNKRSKSKDVWLDHDNARSRCEQAKKMGEILARKRAEQETVDPIQRACVRQ